MGDGSLVRKSGTPQSSRGREQSASRVAEMLRNHTDLVARAQIGAQLMEMDATSDSASDSTAVAVFALPLADLDLETLDTYIDTSAAALDFALFRIHVDRGVTRLWGLIRRVGLSLGSQEGGHLFPEFRAGDFSWADESWFETARNRY